MTPRSAASDALLSANAQSGVRPSAMASANSVTRWGSSTEGSFVVRATEHTRYKHATAANRTRGVLAACPVHLLGETNQRPDDSQAGCVGRGFAQDLSQFRVTETKLHTADDGLSGFRFQALERRVVAVQRFPRDRGFERRDPLVAHPESRVRLAPRTASFRSSLRMRFITA